MGKREADVDGIEYYYDPTSFNRGHSGATIFKIPCAKCGQIILKKSYGRNHIYVCDACKLGQKKKQIELVNEWLDTVETKSDRRFESAIDRVLSQVLDGSDYDDAIRLARQRVELYGSVPEAMVAIELLHLGYKIIPQQKVGRYHVDFAIPKQKLVVEVDGALFHKNQYGGNREAAIQLSLGMDWLIIHVPAELIANDIKKLRPYIDKAIQIKKQP